MTHKSILLLFLFWSIILLNNYAQVCFIDTLQAKVTPRFEVFDNAIFEKAKGSDYRRYDTLPDMTQIFTIRGDDDKYLSITPKDSPVSLLKFYYPNGNIKKKGLMLDGTSERIGMWYYFDEAGNLTDSIDYTKDYSFTLCQFLDSIKDLTIYDIIGGTDKQGIVPSDYLKNRLNKPESITYFEVKNTGQKIWRATWKFDFNFWKGTILMDGKTGEIVNKKTYQKIPSKYR